MRHIARVANGDVRSALGAVELAVLTTPPGEDGVIHVTLDVAEESIQKPVIRCDESLYYDMLSAFCKSLRGSDADAGIGVVRPSALCGRRSPAHRSAHHRARQRGRRAGESNRHAASRRRVAGAGNRRSAGGAALDGHRRLSPSAKARNPTPSSSRWINALPTRKKVASVLSPSTCGIRTTPVTSGWAAAYSINIPTITPDTMSVRNTCRPRSRGIATTFPPTRGRS